MKQVMEQVKRDMEKDPKLKKDWERVQKTSDRLRHQGSLHEDKVRDFGENLKRTKDKTSERLSQWKEWADSTYTSASSKINQTTEENENLKRARESFGKVYETGAESSKIVFARTRQTFSGVMDRTSQAFSYLGDEHKKAEKLKQWKAARQAAAPPEDSEDQAGEATQSADSAHAQTAQSAEANDALVVAKDNRSSWDRFGAGLRDMPFLSSVFENPLFDRLFGESEIAASIREMKQLDYGFHLEEFAEDIEYYVAPHIIKTYLEGDQQALEMHCGEAAFAAVNASIKARKQQKLNLDTSILAGPKEVELKGAKLMDKGPPCFIWTFNMQQVNCLRDHQGEIIEGAVDDIRTVCYAMAVTRHPNLDKPELEYPWQISELAILWNQPCF